VTIVLPSIFVGLIGKMPHDGFKPENNIFPALVLLIYPIQCPPLPTFKPFTISSKVGSLSAAVESLLTLSGSVHCLTVSETIADPRKSVRFPFLSFLVSDD